MAEVFEAVSEGSDGFRRRVALKRVLPKALSDEHTMRMFLDEARVASRLHHPNIVSVIDFGIVDEVPFQILELVDGLDVGRLLQRAKVLGVSMPVEVALFIAVEVAHALHYAHGATDDDQQPLGVVHRDVSPGNVLIAWNGSVRLADFGIALSRDRSEATQTGVSKGTLLYMAPEQMVRGTIDARSDVFGLGCLLHRMLLGHSPLEGDNAMADMLGGTPLRLPEELDEDLREVLGQALDPRRVCRFSSAAAFAKELGTTLARRIDSDPRTVLCEWLQSLREPDASSTPSSDLFDLSFVSDRRGTRHFRTKSSDEAAPKDAPPNRTRWPLWMLGVGVAAAGFAVASWQLGLFAAGGADGIPQEPRTAAITVDTGAIYALAGPPDAGPPVSSPDAAAPPTEKTETASRSRRRRPRSSRDQETASTGGIGTLVIGGAGALRSRVYVDGKNVGFAPKTLDLKAGAHTIRVERPDGSKKTRRVVIEKTHTRRSPLRWILK